MGRPKKNKIELQTNSMTDFVSALGNSNWYGAELSKANTSAYNLRHSSVTLNRSLISEMYQEHGIVQVLVDQPVDDAFRGGIKISSDEFSSEDLDKLYQYIEDTNVIQTYCQALKWARLYGGGAVLINCGQNTELDFDKTKINENSNLEFYAADRWELAHSHSGVGLDQYDTKESDHFYYYGHKIHKSHVLKISGKIAPSIIRSQFSGWGVSEIERLIRPYNMFLKHQDVVFELLDESKIDVFKIQDFNANIATKHGAEITAKRISIAATIKNYQNALVLDKNDDYEQKSIAFGGLSEILKEIRIDLASECRMPMTKLFGLSAAGFSSGEDDIENYNSMIETEIRSKVKKGLNEIVKLCCQKVFGVVPDSLKIEFHPLRVLSAKDESDLKSQNLNRILQALQAAVISPEKAIELINAAKVYEVTLSSDDLDDLDLNMPKADLRLDENG